MKKEDSIDRAVQYILSTDQTPYKISAATGISRMAIGNYKNGKSKPTLANANTIIDYFEKGNEINPAEEGQSNMLMIPEDNRQPILDIRVCAGSGLGLEGDENKIIEWVSIPSFKGCKGITVYGDSMYDKFKSGDVIFVRPIEGRNDVDYGQCYVVITREDRYIKNIYESSIGDEYVTMVSYNTEVNPDGRRKFPDRDILKEDIVFLYKVAGKLRRSQL